MSRAALRLAVLALLPIAASAQGLPGLFSVAGVAAGDALNLRAGPSAAAEVVGTLAPGTSGVEVVARSPDGRWGLVALPEGGAWASLRFLAPEAAGPGLPRPLLCRGTEPFWSVELRSDGGADFAAPGEARELRPLGEAAGVTGAVAAFDDGGRTLDLTILRAACSDGMSDRPYGLAALLWDRGDALLEGCCTLDPR